MPLIKKFETQNELTGVWRMSESLDELMARYEVKPHEKHAFEAFRNDRRRREWITVRILLDTLLGNGVSIEYMESGKPFLRGSKLFISITHTIGYVGVRLGSQPVALDMEYVSNRVLRLIPKFVSEHEMRYVDEDNKIVTALVIWSAKETLFKRFDIPDVMFERHLSVRSLVVNGSEGVFTGCVDKDGFYAEVELHYSLFDDLILVYC